MEVEEVTVKGAYKKTCEYYSYELKRAKEDRDKLASVVGVVFAYIDRMNDPDASCDPAEKILQEFCSAVRRPLDEVLK